MNRNETSPNPTTDTEKLRIFEKSAYLDSTGYQYNISTNSSGVFFETVREYDTAKWTFHKDLSPTTRLAVLPILAMISMVVYVLVKICQYRRDKAKWKARGDVEFCDDDDFNYGILSPGDKNFRLVDIRSDGSSMYDTVNSFRMLQNGNGGKLHTGRFRYLQGFYIQLIKQEVCKKSDQPLYLIGSNI